MKKSWLKKAVAVLLTLVLCCFPLELYAAQENTGAIKPEDKISKELKLKLAELKKSGFEEKVPVWIWYDDINQKQVNKETEEQTGLTEENIAVGFKMPDAALLNRLKNEQPGSQEQMREYLRQTAVGRKLEEQRTDLYVMKRRELSREKYEKKSKKLTNDMALNASDVLFESRYTPSLIVQLSYRQIMSAAQNSNVVSLDLHLESEWEDMSWESLNTASNAAKTRNLTGLTGAGVKVGQIETGTPQEHEDLASSRIHVIGAANGQEHATNVARIMGGSNGIAPGVDIYAATLSDPYKNIEDLISAGVKVINRSHGATRGVSVPYTYTEKWQDHLALYHRVSFVQVAGNHYVTTQQIESPGLAYNTITVGAYKDVETQETSDDYLADYSKYLNGDGCFKPDLVAPVTDDNPMGGTSAAAPVVVGIIALMLELKPSLGFQPQVVKSILLASCQRKVITDPVETMEQGLTEKQGAGAVDAWNAVSIISRRQYGYGEISGAEETRNFVQPQYGASHMNVSVAWMIDNTIVGDDHANLFNVLVGTLHNLDLRVFRNGSVAGSSLKTNSSTEMAYLPLVSPSDKYQIKVSKHDTTNTETVRFGYAWSTDKMTFGENLTGTDYPEGLYYIRHRQSGSYLTVDESTGQVKQAPFTGEKNQQWISSNTGTNPFTIKTNSAVISGGLTKADSGNQVMVGTTGSRSVYYGNSALDNTIGIKLADPVTPGAESLLTVQNAQQASSPAIWSYVSVPERFQWYFEPIGYQRGDANLDGAIGTSDVLLLQNYIGKKVTFNESQKYLADMNNDGNINLSDVSLLQSLIAGMI